MQDMGTRVKLHKIKLGVVGCTKVAKSHRLSVAGRWGKMSKAEQTAFLKCPCGAAKQSFAHVLKACPVAKRVLEAGMGQVDGDTPFEKFAEVLTMREGGLGPGSGWKIQYSPTCKIHPYESEFFDFPSGSSSDRLHPHISVSVHAKWGQHGHR